MVSKWDMKQYIKNNVDKFPYVYKEEEDAIYDLDGNYLSSLNTFLEIYRKHSGESFESIYNEHVSLIDVLKCTECGTVIFTRDDEDYDPHLKCPTCTGYNTYFKFWTKEEIESSKEKQDEIKHLEEMTAWMDEREKRIKRRNGKHDWEIHTKKFYGKKIFLEVSLHCDDVTESYFKGLRLKIDIGKREKDEIGYTIKKFYTIPLSISSFRTQMQVRKYLKEKYEQ